MQWILLPTCLTVEGRRDLQRFNLLASCGRDVEFEAVNELERLLAMVGDEMCRAWESEVKGLIFGLTGFEPKKAIEKLKSLLRERPWEFNILRRVIPIERVVNTDMNGICAACMEIAEEIKPQDTFRITVEKRRTRLSSKELIQAVARYVDAKVDLEKPKKVMLIEIVGGETGISLLEGLEGILNVTQETLKGSQNTA
ncbi:MAG: hypothetical protein GTN80_01795 [Nitrososphaeria archaeon]|nr:hypothetical protein [Nitrososphaeria archaeon]NIN51849.1 hypothetical protein [Nitrososphaeria archaeon]NIQ32371.1 hypothetical protein [Nitrososphaeria archaeon]